MTDIDARALDRELKRGSAELLILSVLEAWPRHGYAEPQEGSRAGTTPSWQNPH